MIAMTLQSRIPDTPHLGMRFQIAGNGQAVGVLAFDAQRQRLDPAQDQVGRVRRDHMAQQALGLAQRRGHDRSCR